MPDTETSASVEETCFTCRVRDGVVEVPGGLVFRDDLVVANHRASDTTRFGTPRHWPGWIIVSPTRHLTRSFELGADEQQALLDVVGRVDRAMTEIFEVSRTMIASLGWNVDDHLHIHTIPTWTQPTQGWLNIATPPPDMGIPPAEIAARVRKHVNG